MFVTILPSTGVILLSELANDFIDVIHLFGKGVGTAAVLDVFALGGVLPVRSGFGAWTGVLSGVGEGRSAICRLGEVIVSCKLGRGEPFRPVSLQESHISTKILPRTSLGVLGLSASSGV